ncbi:hypothetical protein LJC06_01815 [Bacteroidales bacterium OttesenSCG-928-I14]|nr:hypothetical protein [Bacteroidales bacterium OttesenSCG-928-I14]
MRNFDKDSPKRERIRFIFFPFLLLSLVTIALCGGVYWHCVYEKGLDSQSISLIIIIISVLAPFIILRRINLIESKKEFYNRIFMLVCAMSIFIPVLCLQSYIDKSIGKLTHLNNLAEFVEKPMSRFYTVEGAIDINERRSDFTYINPARRGSTRKKLETYCITPIYFYPKSAQTALLGKMYKSDIIDSDNKKSFLDPFVTSSLKQFEQDIRRPFTYLERVPLSENSGYYRALNVSEIEPNEIILLVPHYIPFEERAGNSIYHILLAYTIGIGLVLLIIIISPFNEKRLNCFLSGERYNEFARQTPTKIIKGKIVVNDKLVLVRGLNRQQLEKYLKKSCDSYNDAGEEMHPNVQQLGDNEFIITFPYDVEFELFCYLIYELSRKKNGKHYAEVTGWSKATAGDAWITDDIAGKQLMIYFPAEDKEYNNVYVSVENGECYKFRFFGDPIAPQETNRPYQKPIIANNSH